MTNFIGNHLTLNATFWAIFKLCAWGVVCVGAPSTYNAESESLIFDKENFPNKDPYIIV